MPSISKARIKFYFLKNVTSLRNRSSLKRFLSRLFKKENKTLGSLNYIFCSDSYLLTINKKYLNHNYYTDILTFPLSVSNQAISADIYISIDRIKENASYFQTTIHQELHRVIFHGALHLCGYNDKSKRQISLMRKKEDEYLSFYINNFVPRETTN